MRVGDPLISIADERKRKRILTRDEELRLLNACANRYRSHLRPILICALDTGMRRGEILSLKWGDVDFEERVLTIRAFNTKTMKERQVSLTTRLAIELEKLWDASTRVSDHSYSVSRTTSRRVSHPCAVAQACRTFAFTISATPPPRA